MLCDNCGKREANVKYSENINGRKRELNLCQSCSEKLGIGHMDFSMPINVASFLGDFMEDFMTPEYMPFLNEMKAITCNHCGNSFDDIINTGKFGCADCYTTFEDRIDPILKRMQGSNRHVGRIGKVLDNKIEQKMKQKEAKKEEKKEMTKLEKLQEELKKAIQEERYEEAAKLRDEIKKLEK